MAAYTVTYRKTKQEKKYQVGRFLACSIIYLLRLLTLSTKRWLLCYILICSLDATLRRFVSVHTQSTTMTSSGEIIL